MGSDEVLCSAGEAVGVVGWAMESPSRRWAREPTLCYARCYAFCMATKNRVVRVDDELWDLVRAESDRVGEPIPEVVRYALRKHLAPTVPPCFYCTDPADFRHEVPITNGTDKTPDELIAAMASGIGDPWER